MTEKKGDAKPHNPRHNGGPSIGVDLEDLSRKAVTYGPLRVLGETVLNLCLMLNDQMRGTIHGSNMVGKDENVPRGSPHQKSGAGRRR